MSVVSRVLDILAVHLSDVLGLIQIELSVSSVPCDVNCQEPGKLSKDFHFILLAKAVLEVHCC